MLNPRMELFPGSLPWGTTLFCVCKWLSSFHLDWNAHFPIFLNGSMSMTFLIQSKIHFKKMKEQNPYPRIFPNDLAVKDTLYSL